MVMSNFTNKKEKAINVIQNENGAWMNHGQTQTHKRHYGLDLVGAIIFLPIIYFTNFGEG